MPSAHCRKDGIISLNVRPEFRGQSGVNGDVPSGAGCFTVTAFRHLFSAYLNDHTLDSYGPAAINLDDVIWSQRDGLAPAAPGAEQRAEQ
jgi:hypothetical protein